MTLTDFVLARIAQDEEAALGCPPWPWRLATIEDENRKDVFAGDTVLAADGEPIMEPFAPSNRQQYAVARHVSHWEPARVLAECQAKREQIKQAQALQIENDPITRAMATVWANHTDYEPGWRP